MGFLIIRKKPSKSTLFAITDECLLNERALRTALCPFTELLRMGDHQVVAQKQV
jgi:hypothetical protein